MTPVSRRALRLSLMALAVAAFIVVYTVVDPSAHGWVPRCMVLTLTGLRCPGCGSQRLLHALFTGHPAEAFGYNPFLFCLLPVLVWLVWLETQRKRRPRLYARVHHPAVMISTLAVILLWMVLRNLLDL